MTTKHILLLLPILFLLWEGKKIAAQESENFGLGPLEIRDQFPVALPYLVLTPENTKTLGQGTMFFSYQLAVTNSFLNSAGKDKQVAKEEVKRGLVASDFYSTKTGLPIEGYHMYIDVESYRHAIRFKYGLLESLDFAIEIPYLSFSGGALDVGAETVHTLVGIDNAGAAGAYRSQSERNRYDYFVLKKDEVLINANEPFDFEPGEPTFKLKWNMWEGGSIMPAATVKVAYKLAASGRNSKQKLISSGSVDLGTGVTFSKGFGDWIVYLGWNQSSLGDTDNFAATVTGRFMAMEWRVDRETSLLLQTVTQSSIFPTSGRLQGTAQEVQSAFLSNPTDVAVIGYKLWFDDLLFETGFIEDYNQSGNQTDIVLFFEVGQKW